MLLSRTNRTFCAYFAGGVGANRIGQLVLADSHWLEKFLKKNLAGVNIFQSVINASSW